MERRRSNSKEPGSTLTTKDRDNSCSYLIVIDPLRVCLFVFFKVGDTYALGVSFHLADSPRQTVMKVCAISFRITERFGFCAQLDKVKTSYFVLESQISNFKNMLYVLTILSN